MQHTDGIRGWKKWEEMFAETLKQHFNILPDATQATRSSRPTSEAKGNPTPSSSQVTNNNNRDASKPELKKPFDKNTYPPRFSTDGLSSLARDFSLEVDDYRAKNGNLWVRTNNENTVVNQVLTNWGFKYKALKGWWR